MKIKDLVTMFVCGAVATIGGLAGTEVYHTLRDPYKKAVLKQKIKKVKDVFTAKEES